MTKANVLVSFTARVGKYCMEKDIGFTVENPSRSLLWWMPEMADLAKSSANFFVHMSACMWGSKRNKRTAFFTNNVHMSSMALQCDGTHDHLPWGVSWQGKWSFATAEECECHTEMCQAVALRAAKHARLRQPGGLTVEPGPLARAESEMNDRVIAANRCPVVWLGRADQLAIAGAAECAR